MPQVCTIQMLHRAQAQYRRIEPHLLVMASLLWNCPPRNPRYPSPTHRCLHRTPDELAASRDGAAMLELLLVASAKAFLLVAAVQQHHRHITTTARCKSSLNSMTGYPG